MVGIGFPKDHAQAGIQGIDRIRAGGEHRLPARA
jgi:hypothetical protein